jgi:hypothetical protein
MCTHARLAAATCGVPLVMNDTGNLNCSSLTTPTSYRRQRKQERWMRAVNSAFLIGVTRSETLIVTGPLWHSTHPYASRGS